MTLHTAEVHAQRGDTVATVANLARATLTEAQARLAERRQWALNEKGLAERAGLSDAHRVFPAPGAGPDELTSSVGAADGSWALQARDVRTVKVQGLSADISGVPKTAVRGGAPIEFNATVGNVAYN